MREKQNKRRISFYFSHKNLMPCMVAIIALFFAGIVWINFFGRQWLSMDIYTDTYLATLMAEQCTIFPDGWVFGNQFYGFATPVLAAIIYKIFPDSFYAMATASTIMSLLIISAYIWCVRQYCSKSGLLVGVFCIFCLILGNNAAGAQQGMQIFYTMASYYACYLIGILITLGLYLRLVFDCPPPEDDCGGSHISYLGFLH